jgi:hypothetical protein
MPRVTRVSQLGAKHVDKHVDAETPASMNEPASSQLPDSLSQSRDMNMIDIDTGCARSVTTSVRAGTLVALGAERGRVDVWTDSS